MANLVLVAVYVSVEVCRKVGGSRGENRCVGGLAYSRAKEKCAQCMHAPRKHYENPAGIVSRAWGRAPVPVFVSDSR